MNMIITLTQIELIRQNEEIIILTYISCIITSEFNKFECECYKHMLILFIQLVLLNIITEVMIS